LVFAEDLYLGLLARDRYVFCSFVIVTIYIRMTRTVSQWRAVTISFTCPMNEYTTIHVAVYKIVDTIVRAN